MADRTAGLLRRISGSRRARVPKTSAAPILSDASADAELRERGYARLPDPLLDAETAAEIRGWFDQIYPGRRGGWHNAFNEPYVDYRRKAQHLLHAALADQLAAALPGYEPFLFTYLVKWRGEDADDNFLYCHRDWMYVDETAGDRCYVVFLALEDIDEQNGCVEVLPHGNEVDRMLRGSDLVAPWMQHEHLIHPHMSPVPLATGDAVVWDGAIVHASLPNQTAEPRVAVGIWLRPIGAQLVHYRRVGPDLAELHHVEPEFFAEYTPETLQGFLDELVPMATVPTGQTDYDADEFEDLLVRTVRGDLSAPLSGGWRAGSDRGFAHPVADPVGRGLTRWR